MAQEAMNMNVGPYISRRASVIAPVEYVALPINATTEAHDFKKTTAPITRQATLEDIDALVAIEMSAFDEIYGEESNLHQVADDLHKKYSERVNLLGKWVRVLEDPEQGVYGMFVACPTNLTAEDFILHEPDMTDNGALADVFDLNGKNAYIVNLAVASGVTGKNGNSISLFMDGISLGHEHGIESVFFESRLPGLRKWLRDEYDVSANELTTEQMDAYALEYSSAEVVRSGKTVAKDPLLRHYINFGARPVKLINEAWRKDVSSEGYGVLCEYPMPSSKAEVSSDSDTLTVLAEPETLAIIENTSEDKKANSVVSFFGGAVKWAIAHKVKAALLTSAVAGITYGVATNSSGEIIDAVKEDAPELATAYAASLSAYFGGAAMMLAGAGLKIRQMFSKEKQPYHTSVTQSKRLVRSGFWINAAGGVAAAGVASAAIINTLPPSAWTALAIPALDLYGTLASRAVAYGALKESNQEDAPQTE